MSWKTIKERLKSPVVIMEAIGIITGVIVYFVPQATEPIKIITAGIVSLICLFAGLNNPTDKKNF